MAKERERSDQDGGKVLMVSEVLASASEALTTAAAALTSAATALNSAANALAHTSITDDKILECEINPTEARTSDQIKNLFDDFKARRHGIVKALTTEVESFYRNCNPEEELLCLYGLSDGRWELMQPVEENPPNFPDPAIGINVARDWWDRNKWLDIVAVHSDSWLLALTFFSGYELDKECRSGLFSMINNLPTIHEVVTEASNTPKNSNKASTLEQLIGAFKARRAGILKALTTERESFYRRCYPGKDNYLCLYGLENGTWDVKLPCPVPADLPEPTMGINFARDGNKDWIENIALHSDVWLYRITFFLGFDHDKQSRRELFSMINNLPTILEVVTAGAKKSTNDERTSNKNRKGKQPASDLMPPPSKLDCKHKRLSRGIRISSG